MTEATARDKLRSRLILLLIVAMFFSSFGIAAYLRFSPARCGDGSGTASR